MEEDYGARRDSEYWHVRLPTDDLDQFMWGQSGVPTVTPSAIHPKYQQDWARPENSGKAVEDAPSLAASETSDNVFAALETSGNNDNSPPPIPDKILLEDIVWKQRSGLGKYSFGLFMNSWEKRRVVLFESGVLKYYELGMEGEKCDPSKALDLRKSPWIYDGYHEPLGELHLIGRECTDSDSDEGGVIVEARDTPDDPGPTPFEIDVTKNDSNDMWRLCFECQPIQILWLSMLKGMAPDAPSDGLANHGFEPGDHIIRWEILPVLYPIQIHGIVIEAGRNCVIIADFGLASSYQRDEAKDDSHDVIMAAWEKIKPREKKRLNVVIVTNLKEIRKWSKINYAGGHGKKKQQQGNKFLHILSS